MGLGIIDDHRLDHVPGTATVLDQQTFEEDSSRPANPHLKYDTSGPKRMILVPQPTDDPNDPLNWPLWRRDCILGVLSLLSVLAATLSPILAANTIDLALYYRRSFTKVALLTGWHLLGVAVGGILFVPSARVWGKRHLYLLGTVIIIISSIWAGASNHNYASLLWARIFQGIGLAPFESLVNATVGDMYFVHQRGKRMALTNLALFGGAFFTPVLVGKITHDMGWQWTFYFVAIFTGVLLPAVVFFLPETAYKRSEESANGGDVQRLSMLLEKEEHSSNASLAPSSPPPAKVSWKRSLMPFNGRKTDESYWKLFLRPFPLFFQPAILWACLIQGAMIGWTVFLGIVLAAIMLGPPLFFSEVQTGYMYSGAFVGALVGFVLSGLLSDSTAKWLTRLNKGVYEPEFRIVLVIPQLVIGCAGLYGFGITSNDTAKYGWFLPDFFFALVVCGMVIGAVASALYIVDAHRDIAVEAFTCMMIFKNVFSFGLTWSGYDWLVQYGIKPVFLIISSIQVGICCLSILMYVFGKLNRSFFARHNILKMLGLS